MVFHKTAAATEASGSRYESYVNEPIAIVGASGKYIFPTASVCFELEDPTGVSAEVSVRESEPPENRNSEHIDYQTKFLFPYVDFDEALKCSKDEMIQACKAFPVANWEKWSERPKPIFLGWMVNEMGATMARIRGDHILPFPGIGEGYYTWLQWQKEKDGEGGAKMDVSHDKCILSG